MNADEYFVFNPRFIGVHRRLTLFPQPAQGKDGRN
jgi:hypothetical protein